MEELVEASVRRLVAGHLGVGVEELVGDVSLRDDLAADSLDLLELAIALEAEFAIEVPAHLLDRVRTYGDLVQATGVLLRARGTAPAPGAGSHKWAPLVSPAAPSDHFTAADAAARQRIADVPPLTVTHRLLDQLTGAPTTVTVATYLGDDPWQADDLIASVATEAKRFGDGTPAEQAGALSGTGPYRFVDGDPAGRGRRATTAGHHAHVDQPHHETVRPARDILQKKPTRLQTGPGRGRRARSYRTDLCTEVRPGGELQTWREATCYSENGDGRAFGISSAMTRLTPAGHPAGPQQGLHARFDLATPSANGFRPLTVRLCGAEREGICALLIQVVAQIAGKEQFAQLTLRGAGSTMDVRFLPSTAARAAGLVAL